MARLIGSGNIKVAGLELEVVDSETAECADFVLVLRQDEVDLKQYPTALNGECSVCGDPIIYSPSAPTKPPKVCMSCTSDLMGPRQ